MPPLPEKGVPGARVDFEEVLLGQRPAATKTSGSLCHGLPFKVYTECGVTSIEGRETETYIPIRKSVYSDQPRYRSSSTLQRVSVTVTTYKSRRGYLLLSRSHIYVWADRQWRPYSALAHYAI